MESILKILGLPAAWLLGDILKTRHALYDAGVFSVYRPSLPVIAVGNLQLGGAGKTPMVEYLVRMIKNDFRVAVLSRGYKRHTKGFVLAGPDKGPAVIGDEPYQLYRKFGKEILVAVDENRQRGIELLQQKTGTQVIILDDALQHRRVDAGLKLLLTPYHRPFFSDHLFPAGRLRDLKSRARSVDMIVVTKSPENLSLNEKNNFRKALNTYGKPVLFTSVEYDNPVDVQGHTIPWDEWKSAPFLLVTGIADPEPLTVFLKQKKLDFHHLSYPDHYAYKPVDARKIRQKMDRLGIKRILTTEKDFVKLQSHFETLAYVPIQFSFDPDDEKQLKKQVYEQIKSPKPL